MHIYEYLIEQKRKPLPEKRGKEVGDNSSQKNINRQKLE